MYDDAAITLPFAVPVAVEPSSDEEPPPRRTPEPPRRARGDGPGPRFKEGELTGIMPRALEREQLRSSGGRSPAGTQEDSITTTSRRSARVSRVSKSGAKSDRSRSSLGGSDYGPAALEPMEEPRRITALCRCSLCGKLHRALAPFCFALNRNGKFQFVMFMALLSALFLPDIWILANRPSNDDLDVILTCVWVMFILELFVQLVGTMKTYFNSFFFWTDLLGAASVMLDLTYITSSIMNVNASEVQQNTVVMRAARVAKLGARAGRFTKLVKLLRFLPGMRDLGSDQGTAKVISGRLNFSLSMRVSCLIIVLVIVLPLFSMWTYPEQDWSIKSFMDVLDAAADPLANSAGRFSWQLDVFASFYKDMSYFPYRLEAKPSAALGAEVLARLPWEGGRESPERNTNRLVFESSRLRCEFNFQGPNQIDALLSIILLLCVMTLMVGASLNLGNSVSTVVLRPLEKLLDQVRDMAATVFKSAREMGDDGNSDDDGEFREVDTDGVLGKEVDLLERVVMKLGALGNFSVTRNVPDEEADALAGLGQFDRAVIRGFQGSASLVNVGAHAGEPVAVSRLSEVLSISDNGIGEEAKGDLQHQQSLLAATGLSLELVDSWNLSPLELDRSRSHAAMMYFVGPHNHGVPFEPGKMAAFQQLAEARYVKSNHYHNWFHAIDVTHGVYRLLRLLVAEHCMTGLERFGLLVSAVCHDVGHPGLNNSFLVETSHELALQYNDKSPLEHMHCAKLFEIVAMPNCDIFDSLSKGQFQEVRKVCIEAILATDNAQHFGITKEVQMTYEVNSEVLDAGRRRFLAVPSEFPTREATACYSQADVRKLLVKLVIHIADISNSLKPFRICRIWANQVMEEFFAQGDREKRLGVPVQALNDRGKVSRPFSQIGFIEFLLTPLMLPVVKVIPPMEPLLQQMIQNAQSWHAQWLEALPPPTLSERHALEGRIARLQGKYHDYLGVH